MVVWREVSFKDLKSVFANLGVETRVILIHNTRWLPDDSTLTWSNRGRRVYKKTTTMVRVSAINLLFFIIENVSVWFSTIRFQFLISTLNRWIPESFQSKICRCSQFWIWFSKLFIKALSRVDPFTRFDLLLLIHLIALVCKPSSILFPLRSKNWSYFWPRHRQFVTSATFLVTFLI